MFKKLAKKSNYKKKSKKYFFFIFIGKPMPVTRHTFQILLRAFSHKILCFLPVNLKNPAYMATFIRQK